MDRDERTAYLECQIAEYKTTLHSFIEDIRERSSTRINLLEKEVLSNREERLLSAVEEELAEARQNKVWLLAEIAKNEAELKAISEESTGMLILTEFCDLNQLFALL